MDNSLSFLFGNATTTAKVVDKPPPAENDVFKIPTRIIDRVMDNYYVGDGTVHPGDHLLFIHELCGLFKCAGITTDQVKKKLFLLSLKGRVEEWYKLLNNGQSLEWEEVVPLFYSNFILLVRFIKIGIKYTTFGLLMERVQLKLGGD